MAKTKKPAAKRGGTKPAAPKKAKARTKKPSKSARKKAARPAPVAKRAIDFGGVQDITDPTAVLAIDAARKAAEAADADSFSVALQEAADRGIERAQARNASWLTRLLRKIGFA